MSAAAEHAPPNPAPDAVSRRWRRHYARLWLGQMTSALGDRLHVQILVWIATSAGAGWIVAASPAGRLLVGLVGGAYADRFDRRRPMVGCDLLCALAVASLMFAGLPKPIEGASVELARAILLWLAGVHLVVGMLGSFFEPALQASLPALAPDAARLQAGNAWLDINRRLAVLVGPLAFALLFELLPIWQFFAFDALTFVVSAALLISIGRGYAWRPSRDGPARALLHEIADGARDTWQHADLRYGLLQNTIWNFVLGPAFSIGMALIVRDELGGAAWFGYLTAAYGVGNVATNAVMARMSPRATAVVMHAGGLLAAFGWCLFAWVREPWLLLVVMAVTAAGGPLTDLMLLRLIQGHPTDRIGRIYSLRVTVSRVASSIGLALATPVYGAVGARVGIAAGAVVLGAYAFARLVVVSRAARRAKRDPTASD